MSDTIIWVCSLHCPVAISDALDIQMWWICLEGKNEGRGKVMKWVYMGRGQFPTRVGYASLYMALIRFHPWHWELPQGEESCMRSWESTTSSDRKKRHLHGTTVYYSFPCQSPQLNYVSTYFCPNTETLTSWGAWGSGFVCYSCRNPYLFQLKESKLALY